MGGKVSKHIEANKTAKNRIPLGEFWVGEDGQLLTDPADPETGLKQKSVYDKIKHLQEKLQARRPAHSATRYSNRRPLK